MSYTYSEIDDLLIGDMLISPSLDRQRYVDTAADDINAKLGYIYKLPLVPTTEPTGDPPAAVLPEYQTLLLKGINNKLASGRLIMDVAVGGEQASLHAYGLRLVTEAMNDLMLIANGEVELDAEHRVTDAVQAGRNVPSTKNYDDESLLLGFENTVLRGSPTEPGWFSRPGALK